MYHEDQTEMLLTEEEVKKARDASYESERLKNTFLNVLSHELRTPLNIILGYSSLIKENLADKIGAEDKIYLDNLHSGSERLFKSITQMLEFAQIEAGNYSLNIETTDIINIIQNCIPEHQKMAKEKNLELRTNFSHKKIFVDADVQCVENALNSLISNAVKFTHQGYVEVEVNILEEKGLAICKVRDTGIGISTKYLDHLYQPFSQEDLNVGRNYEGNGLGLALAKRYIEKLGGSLLVDSIKGVGSTFTFTLPLNQSKVFSTVSDKDEQNRTNNILMIDNSGETFELVKAFLKNSYNLSNYSIREFKLEFVQDNSYSHFIFDVDKNYWQQGILICKDIKRHDPFKRPIIIISSEYIEEKIKEFYQAGATRFLVKPFGKLDLTKIIHETIQD
jgi:nitrogen-specific signal transduction histidine kinase/CheY-like chemotaxis protein